jgi:hypothetical protein
LPAGRDPGWREKEIMKPIFIALVLATILAALSPAKADDYFSINWSFVNPDGTVSDSLNFCTGAGC